MTEWRHRLRWLWPFGRRDGVRMLGRESFSVELEGGTYWVHAERQESGRGGWVFWTSDVRDLTAAPTSIAAPPAPDTVIPEVQRRLAAYCARMGTPCIFR